MNKTTFLIATAVMSVFVAGEASAATKPKAGTKTAMPEFKPFPGNNPMTKPTYQMVNMKVNRVAPLRGSNPHTGTP